MEALKNKFKKIYILGTYPEKDWLRLLCTFVLVSLLLMIWSTVYSLNNNNKTDGGANALNNLPPQSHTKGDDLRDLVGIYEKKGTVYTGLFTSNGVGSVDPSR